jgi:hypothetical protein
MAKLLKKTARTTAARDATIGGDFGGRIVVRYDQRRATF